MPVGASFHDRDRSMPRIRIQTVTIMELAPLASGRCCLCGQGGPRRQAAGDFAAQHSHARARRKAELVPDVSKMTGDAAKEVVRALTRLEDALTSRTAPPTQRLPRSA